MPSLRQLGNAFNQMGNAVRTLFGGLPTTPHRPPAIDADLQLNGWPAQRQDARSVDESPRSSRTNSRAHLSSLDQGSRSRVESRFPSTSEPHISATLSAAREVRERYTRKRELEIEYEKNFNEEIELAKALSLVDQAISGESALAPVSSSVQMPSHLSSSDEPLALALANSVVMEDPELKESGLEFIVSIGPQSGRNTFEERLALQLAYSAIESDPDLKDKGLQLSVRSKESEHAKKYDEDLKQAIELSLVSHTRELETRQAQLD